MGTKTVAGQKPLLSKGLAGYSDLGSSLSFPESVLRVFFYLHEFELEHGIS